MRTVIRSGTLLGKLADEMDVEKRATSKYDNVIAAIRSEPEWTWI